MTRYDAYPDHPLCGVPQAVLDIARKVLDDAVMTKDVVEYHAHPIADAVVSELAKAGYLRTVPGAARSSCCDGTGYADYAAVPCPDPACPVQRIEQSPASAYRWP